MLILLVLTGCTSIKIDSVVEQGHSSKITDIAIVVSGPIKWMNSDSARYLGERLDKHLITHVDYAYNPEETTSLSLTDDDVQSDIIDFINNAAKPLVLFVSFDEVYTTGGILGASNASLTIRDINAKKTIWKSTVHFASRGSLVAQGTIMLNDFSDEVMAKLLADGLIEARPRNTK